MLRMTGKRKCNSFARLAEHESKRAHLAEHESKRAKRQRLFRHSGLDPESRVKGCNPGFWIKSRMTDKTIPGFQLSI